MATRLFRTPNKNILVSESGSLVFRDSSSTKLRAASEISTTTLEAKTAILRATQEFIKIQGEMKIAKGGLPTKYLDELLGLDMEIKEMLSWVELGINTVSAVSTGINALTAALELFGVIQSSEDKLLQRLEQIDRKLDEILKLIQQVNDSVVASWASLTEQNLGRNWAQMTTALEIVRNFSEQQGDRADPFWQQRLADAEVQSALCINTLIGSEAEGGYCEKGHWRRPFSARLANLEAVTNPPGGQFPEVLPDRLDFGPDAAGNVWDYRWALPYMAVGMAARLLVLNVIYPRNLLTGRPAQPVRDEVLKFQNALDTVMNKIQKSIHLKNYSSRANFHDDVWKSSYGAYSTITGRTRVVRGSTFSEAQRQCPNLDGLMGWSPDICRLPQMQGIYDLRPHATDQQAAVDLQCQYAKQQLLMEMPYFELCSLQNALGESLKYRELLKTKLDAEYREVRVSWIADVVSRSGAFAGSMMAAKPSNSLRFRVATPEAVKIRELFKRVDVQR
jgi:hypothetical protein